MWKNLIGWHKASPECSWTPLGRHSMQTLSKKTHQPTPMTCAQEWKVKLFKIAFRHIVKNFVSISVATVLEEPFSALPLERRAVKFFHIDWISHFFINPVLHTEVLSWWNRKESCPNCCDKMSSTQFPRIVAVALRFALTEMTKVVKHVY